MTEKKKTRTAKAASNLRADRQRRENRVEIQTRQDIEELRLSEERYRLLFQGSPLGILHLDPSGCVVDCNDRFAEIFGADKDAYRGINLPAALQDLGMKTVIEKALRGGTGHFEGEYTPIGDHRRLMVKGEVKPLLSPSGEITGVIGTFEDITKRERVERQLREAERRYRDLLDSIDLAAVILDKNGAISYCNVHLLELTGWSIEEVLGKNWFDTFVPDRSVKEVFQQALGRREIPTHYENSIATRTGSRRLIRWSNTLLYDLNGGITGTASIGEDITDRREAEEKSRWYSSTLERLLTISREMTSTRDVKKLYRVAAQTSVDLLGFDYSTVMLLSPDKAGLTIVDSIGFPASLTGRFSLVEGQGLSTYVARTKKPDLVEDFDRERRFEVPPLVREHEIRSALCVPMMLEDEVFGVLIGHSLRLRAFPREEVEVYQSLGNQAAIAVKNAMSLEALNRSEKNLRDITSHMAEGLYVLDTTGRITFMNEEAERLFGWTLEELNEKGAHRLVHFRRPDGTPLPIEECRMHRVTVAGERFSSDDEVFVRKDGTVFPVSVVCSPIVEDNRIVASVTAFRDITETKRLEQALLNTQKLDSLGILAGGIAHDFNNLLTSIMGNVSLSRLQLPPAGRVTRLLAEAETACTQAKDLSYRLLTFSKGGEPFKKILALPQFLKDSVNLSLSGSNVTAIFRLSDGPASVEADEGQLRQVINNLVINAREAMPSGGTLLVEDEQVEVDAEAALPLQPGTYIRISFMDQGAGIAPESLLKIFDPYFSTKEMGSEKGRGLGLAICHSIVRKHGGLITAESTVGKGTTMHVYLPLAAPAPAAARTTSTGAASPTAKARILVMDDEERVLAIIREILAYLEYDVVCAREGDEAIDRYRLAAESGAPFDLVILDLTVPGGAGGIDALRKLKGIDPRVRAMVSSGYADDPILKNFKTYGFVGAIAKPYDVGQLSESLRQALAPPGSGQQ